MKSSVVDKLQRLRDELDRLEVADLDQAEQREVLELTKEIGRQVAEVWGMQDRRADELTEETSSMNVTPAAFIWGHLANVGIDLAGCPVIDDSPRLRVIETRRRIFESLAQKVREGKPLRLPYGRTRLISQPMDEAQLKLFAEALAHESRGEMRLEALTTDAVRLLKKVGW